MIELIALMALERGAEVGAILTPIAIFALYKKICKINERHKKHYHQGNKIKYKEVRQ